MRQFRESTTEFENLTDDYGDGVRDATVAQLYRMAELMKPGRIADVTIMLGTKNETQKNVNGEQCLRACLLRCGRNFSARY